MKKLANSVIIYDSIYEYSHAEKKGLTVIVPTINGTFAVMTPLLQNNIVCEAMDDAIKIASLLVKDAAWIKPNDIKIVKPSGRKKYPDTKWVPIAIPNQTTKFDTGLKGDKTPKNKRGWDTWIENGTWYACRTVDPKNHGAHDYNVGNSFEMGITRCSCGCHMGGCSSSGPVNPFGACPNKVFDEARAKDKTPMPMR